MVCYLHHYYYHCINISASFDIAKCKHNYNYNSCCCAISYQIYHLQVCSRLEDRVGGGQEFQVTLDEVWKLKEVLMKEAAKVNQNAINYNIEMVNKNTTVQSWQTAIDNIVL